MRILCLNRHPNRRPSQPPNHRLQMDDEWANALLPGGGLAGLRATLLEAAAAEREREQRERIADAFTAAVGKAVDCEVPDSLLNELGAQQYRCGALWCFVVLHTLGWGPAAGRAWGVRVVAPQRPAAAAPAAPSPALSAVPPCPQRQAERAAGQRADEL